MADLDDLVVGRQVRITATDCCLTVQVEGPILDVEVQDGADPEQGWVWAKVHLGGNQVVEGNICPWEVESLWDRIAARAVRAEGSNDG